LAATPTCGGIFAGVGKNGLRRRGLASLGKHLQPQAFGMCLGKCYPVSAARTQPWGNARFPRRLIKRLYRHLLENKLGDAANDQHDITPKPLNYALDIQAFLFPWKDHPFAFL